MEQMTAAESFDAGIARQIGHYADAVRVPVGYDHILVSETPGLAPDGSLPGDMTRPGHPGMAEHSDDPEPGRREPVRHRQRPAVTNQRRGRPGLRRSPEQVHHPLAADVREGISLPCSR
jgi:hypothetical protein